MNGFGAHAETCISQPRILPNIFPAAEMAMTVHARTDHSILRAKED